MDEENEAVGGCFAADDEDGWVGPLDSGLNGDFGGEIVFPIVAVAALPGWPRWTVSTSPLPRPSEATVAF